MNECMVLGWLITSHMLFFFSLVTLRSSEVVVRESCTFGVACVVVSELLGKPPEVLIVEPGWFALRCFAAL